MFGGVSGDMRTFSIRVEKRNDLRRNLEERARIFMNIFVF